jgi:hypothetical protein
MSVQPLGEHSTHRFREFCRCGVLGLAAEELGRTGENINVIAELLGAARGRCARETKALPIDRPELDARLHQLRAAAYATAIHEPALGPQKRIEARARTRETFSKGDRADLEDVGTFVAKVSVPAWASRRRAAR